MHFKLHTYSEIVMSVANLKATSQLYIQHLGWESVHNGKGDASEVAFWGLPPHCNTSQQLLRFQQLPYGQIRLIEFHQIAQRTIRSGGQTWDTGGILDIDLRVSDIQQTYTQMEDLGWQGYTPPATAEMGPFTVQEVLMKGPDGIVIAFVHRTNPPHPNPYQLEGCTSNVYLSAMIVKDLDLSQHFFVSQLGFVLHNEIAFKPNAPERTMFGMPHNIAPQVNVKLNIIGPEENRNGLLDLVQFEGLTGEDFSTAAHPPNRGILMYRFPVEGIEAYYQYIQQQGVVPVCKLSDVVIAPYGSIKAFAVQSPDGAWLEFYETNSA